MLLLSRLLTNKSAYAQGTKAAIPIPTRMARSRRHSQNRIPRHCNMVLSFPKLCSSYAGILPRAHPVMRNDGARNERKDDARGVLRFTTKNTKGTKKIQRKRWLSVLASGSLLCVS